MTDAAPMMGHGPAGARAVWCRASDRVRLRVVVWPHPGARGTVLILPGRTEHAEKYADTAAGLARRGFASAAVDWRGQGLADRMLADPRKGHVGSFDDYQRDLSAFSQACDAAGLPGPRHMLGHSMGGCIGLRGLMDGFAVASAAFSAPMWGIKVPAGKTAVVRRLSGFACALGLGATWAPPPASGPVCYAATAPFDGNILTSDRAEWDAMQADLCAHPQVQIAGPTLGWLHQSLLECHRLAARPSPAVPVLTAVGGDEAIVDVAAIESRMARWPGGRLLRIDGARHELLMEAPARREPLLDAFAAQFAAHGN